MLLGTKMQLLRIPDERDHPFRRKAIGDSGARRSVVPGNVITDSGQADRLFRGRRSPIPANAVAHRLTGRAQWVPRRREPRHAGLETTDETIARDPETQVRLRAVPPGHSIGLRGRGGDSRGVPAAGAAGGTDLAAA